MKVAAAVVILVLAGANFAPAEVAYEVQDIGDLGGGHSFSTAVNQHGNVGGYSYDESGQSWGFVADGEIKAVPSPNSQVFDLNDEVKVGLAVNRSNEVHAFAWKGKKALDLGTLDGSFSYALGVCAVKHITSQDAPPNDWIAGGAADLVYDPIYTWVSYSTVRPALWVLKERKKGPQIKQVVQLSPEAGWASDVNKSGIICGTLARRSGYWAFRCYIDQWYRAYPTLLGPGYATGINNAGKICGYDTETGISRAKLWKSDDSEVVLPPLVPGCDCWANRINNKEVIVGTATDEIGYCYAVRWDADGTIHNLNDEIMDNDEDDNEYIHFAAMDINNSGQIVTRAWSRTTGLTHSFLLTPID